jgi:membrane associated rhomboid family serine protease
MTPAIKHLLIINTVIFALNAILLGRLSAPGTDGGGYWFAFSWELGTEGYGVGILRLLTYQFTHSFSDAWHFFGNMMVLYFMGGISEERLGYRGTCKLYVLGGICGAVLHLILASIQGYANVPLVGASGACYSFLVYGACRRPNVMVFGIIALWVFAAVLVFVAFYQTFVELAGGYGGGVAHSAHLGGAALGFLAFKQNLFVDWAGAGGGQPRPGLVAGMMANMKQRRAQRESDNAMARQQQLDQILAKVKSDGLAALTGAERKFLEQVSKQGQK